MPSHAVKKDREVTLKGIILPDHLNHNFNVTSIMLSTDREQDYAIEDNEIGRELKGHLRESAVVTGTIRKEDGRKRILTVTSYKIIAIHNGFECG